MVDLNAPFRNVMFETSEQRVARVAGIGRQRLLAWWEMIKGLSFNDTYGDNGCGFASAVAFMVERGGPTDWQRAHPETYRDEIAAFEALSH